MKMNLELFRKTMVEMDLARAEELGHDAHEKATSVLAYCNGSVFIDRCRQGEALICYNLVIGNSSYCATRKHLEMILWDGYKWAEVEFDSICEDLHERARQLVSSFGLAPVSLDEIDRDKLTSTERHQVDYLLNEFDMISPI